MTDFCASVVCYNEGVCVNTPPTYQCICPLGFVGSVCETGKAAYIFDYDGWMTCNFMFVLTVFQSYLNNEWETVKCCVQWKK